MLDARPVRVPAAVLRAGLALGWHLHLTPASPHLFDLALHLPVLDSGRAERELGWTPQHSSLDAIGEFLAGMRAGEGMDTPPLLPDRVAGRIEEFATGVGERP